MTSEIWWTIGQIVLMLLACYACYVRGVDSGINLAVESLEEQGLLNQEKFNRRVKELTEDE
jgi:hypothetical protein